MVRTLLTVIETGIVLVDTPFSQVAQGTVSVTYLVCPDGDALEAPLMRIVVYPVTPVCVATDTAMVLVEEPPTHVAQGTVWVV